MDIDETIGKEKLQWFADGVQAGYFRLVGEDQYFSTPSAARLWRPTLVPARASAMCRRPLATPSSWAACPHPQEGPVKYISQWASNYVCLSKDEAHARGAYLFMKHFSSEEVVVD